jgi:hypothetical protein
MYTNIYSTLSLILRILFYSWRRINDKDLQLGSPDDRSLIVKKMKLTPEVNKVLLRLLWCIVDKHSKVQ